MCDFTSDEMGNFINGNGKPLKGKEKEIKKAIAKAEEITKHLLGCTLVVRGRKFILSMLELYYGGVGDPAHDWYRKRFLVQNSNPELIEQTRVQEEKGLKIYISHCQINPKNYHVRFDIVIGPDNVAVSVLVRGVLNEELRRIGNAKGQPNVVLRHLDLRGNDHGEVIKVITPGGKCNTIFCLIDTHDEFIRSEKDILHQHRIGVPPNFEKRSGRGWNFSLKKYHQLAKRG